MNDIMAIDTRITIKKAGLSVSEDISVIGYVDAEIDRPEG